MKSFFTSIYLRERLFWILGFVVVFFALGFSWPIFYVLGKISLLVLTVFILTDFLLLYAGRKDVSLNRILPEKFSNGDENEVQISISNPFPFPVNVTLIDELPDQFQIRKSSYKIFLSGKESREITYSLRPVERGSYAFAKLNAYVSLFFPGVLERRFIHEKEAEVKVYPSFLQLRKYEMLAISNNLTEYGIKKIRRIGHNLELDLVREYVTGDDQRDVNWKASARRGTLMVNQYQDERSQHIYNVIDKGRAMKMPFEGMSLLDYAINSSLVLSRVSLLKSDKPGLITFSNRIGSWIKSSSHPSQMQLIMEHLYNEKTRFQESDFTRLYRNIKMQVKQRSLILLYTNFETEVALQRQLPYIRKLAKDHLVVVIFFLNTELNQLTSMKTANTEDIYLQTIAEKLVYDKKMMVKELNKYGIHAVLTTPQNLTVSALNKYLELKSRGMI
jgi:uncharacterized protein (DUF58 family)